MGYNYIRIEPFGTLFGSIADFTDIWSRWNSDEAASSDPDALAHVQSIGTAFILAVARNVTSRTYMRGLAEAMAAITDPEQSGARWLQGTALGYMSPGALSQSRRIFDPVVREATGLLETLASRTPGFSSSLPARYDWISGDPVVAMGGRTSGVSPIVSQTNDPNNRAHAVAREMLRLPEAFHAPVNHISGVRLNSQQISDYRRLHGTVQLQRRTMVQELERMFQGRQYQNADDETQVMMVRQVIQRYRSAARDELLRLHPELGTEIQANRRRGGGRGGGGGGSRNPFTQAQSPFQQLQQNLSGF